MVKAPPTAAAIEGVDVAAPQTARFVEFPLSHNQRGVLLAHQVDVGGTAHNGVMSLRVRGLFNVTAFERAWRAFTRRHPSCRTTFHLATDGAFQRVHEDFEADFDAYEVSPSEAPEALHDRVYADTRRKFDLTQGALRCSVFVQAPHVVVVAVVAHHIAWDALSTDTMLDELFRLYVEETGGPAAVLPPLTATYQDYVSWQSRYVSSAEAEEIGALWVRELEGAPSVIDLPLDRPRAVVPRVSSRQHVEVLPPDLVSQLKQLNKSFYRTLLTVFHVVLVRYTQQDDIVIGTAASSRYSPAFGDVTGNFVNMLPLRLRLDAATSLRDALASDAEVVRAAVQRRFYPFDVLLERLKPRRIAGVPPLFQVAIGLNRMTRVPAASSLMMPISTWSTELGGVSVEAYPIVQHDTQIDMELMTAEEAGTVFVQFKYNADLFDPATIERMAASFASVARQMVSHPDRRIDEVDVISDEDRRKLFVEWNDTKVAFPDACMHELVAQRAALRPEATAVVDDHGELTYQDLDRSANRLANYLRSRGVASEELVALCVERSCAAVVAMLAIMKAGAAFMPIDPAAPRERIHTMLKAASVKAAVVTGRHRGRFAGEIDVLVPIDRDQASWGSDDKPPSRSTGPSSLAYCIFTSGSTGVPKGVLLQHEGMVNTATWMQRELRLDASTRASQIIPTTFDASVAEIWPCLVAGGTLVIGDDEKRLSPQSLLAWMRDRKITVACMATPLAEACLREGFDVPTLETLVVGGDRLHRPSTTHQFELVNAYGPTEYTVNTSFHRVDCTRTDGPPAIGKPIANTKVFVLDQHGSAVPIGVSGELYVGGVGLARGYLNDLDLTASRFVPNPVTSTPARLYRTGDLVRYRANGDLEFLGRSDKQIKIRGFRIELGEIEAALLKCFGVREAVVVARGLEGGHSQLVAYVVSADDGRIRGQELRELLKERLPDYMVPSVVVQLTSLPLSSNGKIDLNALPAPVDGDSSAHSVAPETETERRLSELWFEVLRHRRFGVTEDFFEVGGDSLLAMELMTLVRQRFGLELPAVTGTKATVRQQAKLLDARRSQPAPNEIVVLQEQGLSTPLLLVHAVGGRIEAYNALASRFGHARPLLAIAAPHRPEPFATIEALAAHYVDALKRHIPHGPVVVGGWSFGGVVAYEMARQLERLGNRVPHLVLLDSLAPSLSPVEPDRASLVRFFFADMLPGAADVATGSEAEDPLKAAFESLVASGAIAAGVRLDSIRESFRIFEGHIAALKRYSPLPYGGRTLLLHSENVESSSFRPPPDRGWSTLAAQLDIVPTQGTHYSMMNEPHVRVLVERLVNHLREE